MLHFQGELIESVLRKSLLPRHVSHRGLQLHPVSGQAERLLSCRMQIWGRLGPTPDDQGYLSSHIGHRPLRKLLQRAAADFLIGLGELTANRTAPIASKSERHR